MSEPGRTLIGIDRKTKRVWASGWGIEKFVGSTPLPYVRWTDAAIVIKEQSDDNGSFRMTIELIPSLVMTMDSSTSIPGYFNTTEERSPCAMDSSLSHLLSVKGDTIVVKKKQ